MKKFMLVVASVAMLGVSQADARGPARGGHHSHNGRAQQQVVINNYSNVGHHGGGHHYHYGHRVPSRHTTVYYSNGRNRTAEAIAVSLGVVGAAAIISTVLR